VRPFVVRSEETWLQKEPTGFSGGGLDNPHRVQVHANTTSNVKPFLGYTRNVRIAHRSYSGMFSGADGSDSTLKLLPIIPSASKRRKGHRDHVFWASQTARPPVCAPHLRKARE
jgi:hypothetical protein